MKNQQKRNLRLAVALKYENKEENAPVVVASGKGRRADKIIAGAEKAGVPTYVDEDLVSLLASLEIGTEIPVELYEAVSQVIAFVWQLDKKYAKE